MAAPSETATPDSATIHRHFHNLGMDLEEREIIQFSAPLNFDLDIIGEGVAKLPRNADTGMLMIMCQS